MKRFVENFRLNQLLLLAGLLFFLSSCENTVDPPNDDNNPDFSVNAGVKSTAQFGWQMMHQVNTSRQFNDILEGEDGAVTDEMGMINTMGKVRKQASKMYQVRDYARAANLIQKGASDSLIWYEEWTDPESGISGRRGLYYDPESGNARIFEVIFDFPADVEISYDSTSVAAFLGPDLNDDSDDRVLSLDKETRFTPGFHLVSVLSNVTPTAYDDDNEIISATAENIVNYGNDAELSKLTQNAEFNHEENSTFSELLEFRDNTTHSRSITFYPSNTGIFSESWRDGTTVNGDFDDFEDDNQGSVNRIINFASNPLVTRLEQGAAYALNPDDSSSTATLTEIIDFTTGNVDSTRVNLQRRMEDGYWREYLTIRTNNEGQASLKITYFDEYKEIEAEHIDTEDRYYRLNAVEYPDGSGELWLKVYTSQASYNSGDDPIYTLHIIYGPDGSGKGEVTEGDMTYQVTLSADGEIEVVNNTGESEAFSAYSSN